MPKCSECWYCERCLFRDCPCCDGEVAITDDYEIVNPEECSKFDLYDEYGVPPWEV